MDEVDIYIAGVAARYKEIRAMKEQTAPYSIDRRRLVSDKPDIPAIEFLGRDLVEFMSRGPLPKEEYVCNRAQWRRKGLAAQRNLRSRS